jgi:hypothetical protein
MDGQKLEVVGAPEIIAVERVAAGHDVPTKVGGLGNLGSVRFQLNRLREHSARHRNALNALVNPLGVEVDRVLREELV